MALWKDSLRRAHLEKPRVSWTYIRSGSEVLNKGRLAFKWNIFVRSVVLRIGCRPASKWNPFVHSGPSSRKVPIICCT